MSSGRNFLFASIVGLVAVMASASTTAIAATRTPWNTNLVKNAGAEAGPASVDGYQVVGIPRWTGRYGFTVVKYGEFDFPTVAEAQRIGGGTNFFAAGVADADTGQCGNSGQWIPIRGRNAAIDAGRVRITLSGYVAGYGVQVDDAVISAVMATAKDPMAGFAELATDPLSGNNSIFRKVQKSMILPAGTRWIKLGLVGIAHDGAYCDAYFDKISVKLKLI